VVYFTVVFLAGRRLRAAGGVEALAAVGAGLRNEIAKISSWKDGNIPWELMVLICFNGISWIFSMGFDGI